MRKASTKGPASLIACPTWGHAGEGSNLMLTLLSPSLSSEMASQLFSASGQFAFQICELCVFFARPEILLSALLSLQITATAFATSFVTEPPALWRNTLFCLFWSCFLWPFFNRFSLFLIGNEIDLWHPIHPLCTPPAVVYPEVFLPQNYWRFWLEGAF